MEHQVWFLSSSSFFKSLREEIRTGNAVGHYWHLQRVGHAFNVSLVAFVKRLDEASDAS